MLELCIPAAARPLSIPARLPRPEPVAVVAPSVGRALGYRGPERRSGAGLLRLLAMMLDEVDYGLVLLADGPRVQHANHAARASLSAPQHPLVLQGYELRARCPKDAAVFHQALQAAAVRGLRRLLTLGEGGRRAGVAIVPLGSEAGGAASATLVLLGRPEVCGGLSVHGFAREHRLSPSEEQVLAALCEGCCPNVIAQRHGVKIATVRTQIANIRAKTGADSIRDLVQQVAVLPPLVGALRAGGASAGAERAVA